MFEILVFSPQFSTLHVYQVLADMGNYDYHATPNEEDNDSETDSDNEEPRTVAKEPEFGSAKTDDATADSTGSTDGTAERTVINSADLAAPSLGGPSLAVQWRGVVHMRGTYPRELLITAYHPGAGVARDHGPSLKKKPRKGGPCDCSISAVLFDR